MLCLMSSSHPDRSDIDGHSRRLGKRKAESESVGEEFDGAARPRSAKRSASRGGTLEGAATHRSGSLLEGDTPTIGHLYNAPGFSARNERGIAGFDSRDPFIREDFSLDSPAFNLYSNPPREHTLASLLGEPAMLPPAFRSTGEPAMLPPAFRSTTSYSSTVDPRFYPQVNSLRATSDPFRMGSFSSSTSTQGRDLLLARQRSPHQYNSSISSPSGISRSAESKESSPVPVATIGPRFHSGKMERRPSSSYEQSVSHAQDILNRQRYAEAITLHSTNLQEQRTLRDILANPTEQSMASATSSFPQHRASAATSVNPSWMPPRSTSSMYATSTLADMLSSRRRSSLTATASTTPNYSILGDASPSRRFSLPPRLFPSEQQSALDNALVFSGQQLSHHLSSYPSAASAQSSSWPSVAMEVEALAASFAQREFAARQSLGTGIPTNLPVSLSLPEDSQVLSELQVYIRQQIEVFRASEEDTLTHKRGRNKPITVGQVGIRCRHCAHLPIRHRQVGSTYFPSSLMGIYQVAQNMAKFHLQTGVCSEIPVNTQRRLDALIAVKKASVTSGVGRRYWAESAKSIGLVDTEESGIRFIRDL